MTERQDQMQVPFSPPDITDLEVERVVSVLRSGWITTGPVTKQLERDIAEYCGMPRAACLGSATAAMELSLRLLGIGPGDEVITSAYSYSASASVIDHVGANIVFVDSLPSGVLMDPQAASRAINTRTKAIIPVDVGGIPADYDALHAVIDEKRELFAAKGELQSALARIALVGDAAHSFGAQYRGRSIAHQTDFCCFSFHAVKNLTTAEGGAVCFEDIGDVSAEELYKRLMLLSLHGQSKDALSKTVSGGWEYDILSPAYKCNMTDLHAAIGAAQLSRYDQMLLRRKQLVEFYDRFFAGSRVVPISHFGETFESSYHAYIVSVEGITRKQRDDLIDRMAAKGVSLNVHYKPLPMMTAYRNLGFSIADFPQAYAQFERTVTLPLFSKMTDEQAAYAASTLLSALDEMGHR